MAMRTMTTITGDRNMVGPDVMLHLVLQPGKALRKCDRLDNFGRGHDEETLSHAGRAASMQNALRLFSAVPEIHRT